METDFLEIRIDKELIDSKMKEADALVFENGLSPSIFEICQKQYFDEVESYKNYSDDDFSYDFSRSSKK